MNICLCKCGCKEKHINTDKVPALPTDIHVPGSCQTQREKNVNMTHKIHTLLGTSAEGSRNSVCPRPIGFDKIEMKLQETIVTSKVDGAMHVHSLKPILEKTTSTILYERFC